MDGSDRVLVVGTGDHLDAAADRLRSAGATARRVADGEAALDALGDADGVLVAADLPDGDGIDLADRIARRAGDLPVVLYPAADADADARDAVGTAVDAFATPGDGDDAPVATVADAVEGPAATGDGGAVGRAGDRVSFDLKERAMDAAPVGITIADADAPDVPLVYANDAFERITGYDARDVVGRNCRFLQGEATDEEPVAAMRAAIENGEAVSVELRNYTNDGEQFWNKVDIAPLRRDGEVTHFVGFQTDVTERKEAEAAARRRAEQLEHLLDRIDGLVSDVTAVLVESTDPDGILAGVCDRLAATAPYVGAWAADLDVGTGRLATGDDDLDPDALPDDDPTRTAVEDRTVATAPVDALPDDVRRERAPEGSRYLVTVPVAYDDRLQAVVHCYATERLDDREAALLGSVGRMVGTGVHAARSRRMLTATTVTRVAFSTTAERLWFVALSAALNCRVTYAGSAPTGDDAVRLFVTVEDAGPDAVLEFAAARDDVAAAEVVAEADGDLTVAVTPAGDSLADLCADHGAGLRSIEAEGGQGRFEVDFPQGRGTRRFVERVTDRYPGTELAAYREDQRPQRSGQAFRADLRESMTDRQFTALQTAFAAGFFESPRPVSGDELADSMGITRPTFHQHLRAALRKLVAEFLEEQPIE